MKRSHVIESLTILLVLWSTANADVPKLINYQGRLTNTAGVPVPNSTYPVTFTIYNAAAGGTNLWSETNSVTTSSGLFAVLLGNNVALPDSLFADTIRYIGIQVSADPELIPRHRLATSPYSYRVSTVDGASGGNITSKVSIGPGHTNTGANAFVAGSGNTASGNVATVSGGEGNNAGGFIGTVGGGAVNTASNDMATVGGGWFNTASGVRSTVGGGQSDTASGFAATVPGGFNNTAGGFASFAAGTQAKALHGGTFVWGDNSFADFASTAPNQFLIRASGGVGIGTNSPATTLHVANSTSPAGITLGVSAAAGGYTALLTSLSAVSGGHVSLQAIQSSGASYGNLILNASGGNIGIGTTAPAALLHVNGTAGNNTGVWSNLSDRRLKKDIAPISNALATVEQLEGVTFRWKDSEKDAQFGRVRGLIAQDVEKILPEWVKTDPDGYKRLEPIGVDALLIEAIKEQQKQIEELKEKIARLEKTKTQARVE